MTTSSHNKLLQTLAGPGPSCSTSARDFPCAGWTSQSRSSVRCVAQSSEVLWVTQSPIVIITALATPAHPSNPTPHLCITLTVSQGNSKPFYHSANLQPCLLLHLSGYHGVFPSFNPLSFNPPILSFCTPSLLLPLLLFLQLPVSLFPSPTRGLSCWSIAFLANPTAIQPCLLLANSTTHGPERQKAGVEWFHHAIRM